MAIAETYEPDNIAQVKVEFGILIMVLAVASGFGFWLMGSQGVFTDNRLLLYYLLYLFLNITYIGFAGLFTFGKAINSVFVYLHNFDYSWIQNNGLFSVEKGSVMGKIFSSFLLSLVFWHVILSPLLLLQFILPRETSILLFPVTPQVVFPLIGALTTIFFTIFPASTGETGILAVLNSVIKTGIIKVFKNKTAIVWISLVVISLFSGFMWTTVHGFVSQGQEVNKISHYAFGMEQGFLMVVTGSIAPAIALHNLNLLFYGVQDVVGEYEFLKLALPVTIALMWIGTIYLINRIGKRTR